MNIFKKLIITLVGIWAYILGTGIFLNFYFSEYIVPRIPLIFLTIFLIILFIFVTYLFYKMLKETEINIKIKYNLTRKGYIFKNLLLWLVTNIILLLLLFCMPPNYFMDELLGLAGSMMILFSEGILLIGPVFSIIIIKLKDTISNYIQTRKKNNQ